MLHLLMAITLLNPHSDFDLLSPSTVLLSPKAASVDLNKPSDAKVIETADPTTRVSVSHKTRRRLFKSFRRDCPT